MTRLQCHLRAANEIEQKELEQSALAERGAAPFRTLVVSLDVELLGALGPFKVMPRVLIHNRLITFQQFCLTQGLNAFILQGSPLFWKLIWTTLLPC